MQQFLNRKVVAGAIGVVTVLVGALFFLPGSDDHAGLSLGAVDSNWDYKVEITASTTLLLEDIDVYYFPLSEMPSAFWTNVRSDGCDIRMSTSSTGASELAIDLAHIDTTAEQGALFFDTESISTTVETPLYLFYGNSSASCYADNATYGAENVWDEYLYVYHLNQGASTASGFYDDETSNAYDGTGIGSVATSSPYLELGSALTFNGTNVRVDLPTYGSFFDGSNDFTFMGWIYAENIGSTMGVFHPREDYDITIEVADTGNFVHSVWDGGFNGAFSSFSEFIVADQWTLVGARADVSTRWTSEFNQTDDDSWVFGESAAAYPTPNSVTEDNSFGYVASFDNRWFDGRMSHMRVKEAYESDDWMKTAHYNMASSSVFWSVGAQESSGLAPGGDTCSPESATSTWVVDLADDCYITTDIYHENGLACYGTGSLTFASGITRVASTTCNDIMVSTNASLVIGVIPEVDPLVFYDSFTEGSITELSLHTPDTGTGWTELIDSGSNINVSALDGTISCTGGFGDGSLYQTDDTITSADYRVSATSTNADTNDDMNYLAARIQDSNNLYVLAWNEETFQLAEKTGGSWSSLGSDQGEVVVDGDTVYLDVTGTTISAGVNGTEQVSVTDTSHSSAGKAGVGMGNIDREIGEDCSLQEIDNFRVATN